VGTEVDDTIESINQKTADVAAPAPAPDASPAGAEATPAK
jgi:ribosomal protein L12E/L44/L45/RPP1/RPP2